MKPKKPNSAIRKIARVRLFNKKMITVAIPGQGHNLNKYAEIIVRGGRSKDLPGVRYRAVKGLSDFSWHENFARIERRSKYGTPKIVKNY